jgi:hypothetical protein
LPDKKLKEAIVGAMNSGQFTTDACVPIFARFAYMRNKATKQLTLTLTWLKELTDKLIEAPILEFLYLLLGGGIFDMVAHPTLAIRQLALAFSKRPAETTDHQTKIMSKKKRLTICCCKVVPI